MEDGHQPSADELALLEQAREASTRAYVPYSSFAVGAALALEDGSVVTGCNVENASYGLTICAERTALVRLVAEGGDPASVRVIAIHVDGPDGSPCGACRQFIAELAPSARVVFPMQGAPVAWDASQLLPAAFTPEALER